MDETIEELRQEIEATQRHRQKVLELEDLAWEEFEQTGEGGQHLLALSGVILNLLDRQALLLSAIRQIATKRGPANCL